MCGRLNITDDPLINQLLLDLGVENHYGSIPTQRFIRATDKVHIVLDDEGLRRMPAASWWLLQERTESGFKPSRYTSFNSRSDKLFTPQSASYQPFRQSRCLVIATGFGETLDKGKQNKRYFDFWGANAPLIFAGLYKTWRHPNLDGLFYSFSIITLPPHPKLIRYHDKASPMMLPNDIGWLNAWLDARNQQVELFIPLLTPTLYQPLWVQEVDKPSTYQALNAATLIASDVA
jgi:putative SOS response-associated peptidase YedK